MTNRNRNRSSLDARHDKTIVVAHFEYSADRAAYDTYVAQEGESAAYRLRWPFRKIVCGSWTALRFPASPVAPVAGPIHSRCQPDHDEKQIALAFFQFLESEMDEDRMPTLVIWNGEAQHIPSLRRVAQRHDLILPPQLWELAPDADIGSICAARFTMAASIFCCLNMRMLWAFRDCPCKRSRSQS